MKLLLVIYILTCYLLGCDGFKIIRPPCRAISGSWRRLWYQSWRRPCSQPRYRPRFRPFGQYHVQEQTSKMTTGSRRAEISKTSPEPTEPTSKMTGSAHTEMRKTAVADPTVFLAYIIVDDKMKVYADGVVIGSNTKWNVTKTLRVPLTTTVIAIKAVNNGGPCGIKASFDDAGLVTDGKRWRCSAKKTPNWTKISFDDSQWCLAKEISYHGATLRIRGKEKVAAAAKWIWTNSDRDDTVYCRAKIEQTSKMTGSRHTKIPKTTAEPTEPTSKMTGSTYTEMPQTAVAKPTVSGVSRSQSQMKVPVVKSATKIKEDTEKPLKTTESPVQDWWSTTELLNKTREDQLA